MNVILVTVKLPGLVRPFLATYDRVSQVALDGQIVACQLVVTSPNMSLIHSVFVQISPDYF